MDIIECLIDETEVDCQERCAKFTCKNKCKNEGENYFCIKNNFKSYKNECEADCFE